MSFGSVSDSASFVVGSVYHKIGAQIYLIDQVRGQWDFTETVAQVRALTAKWPVATRKLIEKRQTDKLSSIPYQTKFKELFRYSQMLLKNLALIACQPIYEAGNVLCPTSENAPWIDDHISEMLSFLTLSMTTESMQNRRHWTIGVKELSEKWPKKCLTFNLRTLILRKTGGSIFDMDYSTSYWNRRKQFLNHKRKRFPMGVQGR